MADGKVPLTNAQRQARWRERHLGSDDATRKRLSLVIDGRARRRLARIARYRGYTVTELIEAWAEQAENRILARLSPAQEQAYFDAVRVEI